MSAGETVRLPCTGPALSLGGPHVVIFLTSYIRVSFLISQGGGNTYNSNRRVILSHQSCSSQESILSVFLSVNTV